MLKVQLNRDLRKTILRGHPWVYREALQSSPRDKACLCEVLDRKKQKLAWALYSPEGPLALRILSTEKKPPNQKTWEMRFERAWQLRSFIRTDRTSAYRLFNGEGDRLPGLVCDIYGAVAVLQFDGPSCFDFWDQEFIAQWLMERAHIKTVYVKPRRSEKREPLVWGEELKKPVVEISENGVRFLVNIVDGQKTGFFLDQRDNRDYVGTLSKGKSVANLFSYTGGFFTLRRPGGREKSF
jgi:23S rRNA (cytosine1962-C5)-methyltransferase